jgi:hypothetical protein
MDAWTASWYQLTFGERATAASSGLVFHLVCLAVTQFLDGVSERLSSGRALLSTACLVSACPASLALTLPEVIAIRANRRIEINACDG